MFRYTTPLGSFKTATAAAKAHNMTQPGICRRLKSSNWPEYIDNNNKAKNQVNQQAGRVKGVLGIKWSQESRAKHKIALTNRTSWTVQDTSNMNVHCRIAIITPKGEFESFTAAAAAYNVSVQAISNWVHKAKFAYKGFSIKDTLCL